MYRNNKAAVCISSILTIFLLFQANVECMRTNNMGTQFVVAFFKNADTSASTAIYVSAYVSTNVYVYSQQPGFTTLHYTIAAGNVQNIPVGSNFLSTTAGYNTYYIEADQLVTVSGINQMLHSTDTFLVYPIDISEPTSFRVLSYNALASFGYPSVIGVVATQNDNTVVTIQYSSTSSITTPTTITLNKYQGISIESSGDLTGTLITSNYPIAVFTGTACSYIPTNVVACDHTAEQMMPTSTWGKTFYTVPVPTRLSYDVFRVVANTDQTAISVNDVFQTTINSGQYYEFQLTSSSYNKISADQYITLAQYCVGSSADNVPSDPYMTVVPPAEQYLSSYIVTTPVGGTSFSNYVSIIVDSQYSSGILLDGSSLSMTWNQIGSTTYVGGWKALSTGTHSISHQLPAVQFGVLLSGFGDYESYGNAAGVRLSPIAIPCVQTATVINDGIDNDCDGRIDEEYLNGIDDDGDGLIDEDLVSSPNCDDSNACTYDYFDGSKCQHTTITCNDNNVCTSDSCDTVSGCVYAPLTGTACSDNSVCTLNDQCSNGLCVSGPAISCDDSIACTVDTCDSVNGCQHTPQDSSCDDSISCTTNVCDVTSGCIYIPVDSNCPAGPYCTSPVCSAITGCGLSTNDALCPEDQYACTTAVCTAADGCGFTTDNAKCNDGFQCTTDVCTTASGCEYTAVNSLCNDNIACTVDTCGVGVGCIFTPVNASCDDSLFCTDDICDPTNGCEYIAYNSRCNDYDQCTTDICTIGSGCSNVFETTCDITFTISNVTMNEGTGSNTNFIFTVSIPRNSSVELTVYLSTVAGTAISGSDYEPLTNYQITFPPYTLQVNVPVVVIGDNLFEGNNTFYLVITEATSNQPMIVFNTESVGLGTILNDDNPVLSNDVYYVGQKLSLTVGTSKGLFSNDNVEIQNNPFAIARLQTQPRNGTLTLNTDGSFTYQTNACYVDDRFVYYVKDVAGVIYSATVLFVANLCKLSEPISVIYYYPVVIAWFDIPSEAANEVSFYLKVTDKNGVEVTSPSWEEIKPRGPLPSQSILWNPASLVGGDVYNLTLISEPNSYSWEVYPNSFVPIPFAGYNRKLCTCT